MDTKNSKCNNWQQPLQASANRLKRTQTGARPLLKITTQAIYLITLTLLTSKVKTDCDAGYCIKCKSDNSTQCEECQDNYKLEENRYGQQVCKPDFVYEGCKIQYCEACKDTSINKCISCANGYTNNATKDYCSSYGNLIIFVCAVICFVPPICYFCLYLVSTNCGETDFKTAMNLIKDEKREKLKKINSALTRMKTVGAVNNSYFDKPINNSAGRRRMAGTVVGSGPFSRLGFGGGGAIIEKSEKAIGDINEALGIRDSEKQSVPSNFNKQQKRGGRGFGEDEGLIGGHRGSGFGSELGGKQSREI